MADAIDIVIVALVVYFLLRLIRGTRAVQMVFGLIALLVVYWISVLLKLVALRTVLSALIFYLPFAIIVLFAQELRRALAAFGRTPFFALFSGYHAEETVSDLVLAATSLSTRRVGALIVLERREGLKTYIENGMIVDAGDLLRPPCEPVRPGDAAPRRRRHHFPGADRGRGVLSPAVAQGGSLETVRHPATRGDRSHRGDRRPAIVVSEERGRSPSPATAS